MNDEEEGRRASRFYRSAFEEVDELGLSIEALDQVADGDDEGGAPLPVYFEVEADRSVNKSDENDLFVNEVQQSEPTDDYAEYDNESSYYDKEADDQPVNGNGVDEGDGNKPGQTSNVENPNETTEVGQEVIETPGVDPVDKEEDTPAPSSEETSKGAEQTVLYNEDSNENTENASPDETSTVVEVHDEIVKSSEPVGASTPSKDLDTVSIPPQSELIVETAEDEGGEKAYESPVPPLPQKGISKNDTLNSNVSSTDLNDTWSVVCDHYKTLPLPNSPWHSYQEASAGQDAPSLPLDPKNYTPLIAESDGRENTFASSITSAVNFKDFERELSFGPSLPDKVPFRSL